MDIDEKRPLENSKKETDSLERENSEKEKDSLQQDNSVEGTDSPQIENSEKEKDTPQQENSKDGTDFPQIENSGTEKDSLQLEKSEHSSVAKKEDKDDDQDVNIKSDSVESAMIVKENESMPESKDNLDEYEYTKQDAFTSEIYKISVSNMPRRFGFAEFKKRLNNQLCIKPNKMKFWKDMCFITFRCEEDKEDALKKIDGHKWRGQALKAASAKPAADPLMRKRKQEQVDASSCSKDKKSKPEEDNLSPTERLKNSVAPLWKLSYSDQLKKKHEEMKVFLRKLYRNIEKTCPDMRKWLMQQKEKYNGLLCELQEIKSSPQTEGYRNKCEFTIGPGLEGEKSVVGFRYGLYSEGTVNVGSPDEVAFLPDNMKSVIKVFQSYLCKSVLEAYNPENHTGYWRQLTIRTSRLDHIMVMMDFHPQSLSEEAIESEKSQLRDYFMNGDGRDCGITSCYFRSHTERMTGASTDSPYKLVFGDEHITEQLLGMQFRISFNAFFQVNTAAAEVLYKQVSDWCNSSPTTTVLDVCCGTGTIGLTVAKNVEKVIGVEMCAEAIKDAEFNAKQNGISNVQYYCSKAEDIMRRVTRSVRSSDNVVAIVDPPRGGLHSSVLVAIRNSRSINSLVYVSCNVNGALNNFIDLVRPTSKRLKGARFYPVKAIPVDLFPHTNHCELVMLFEREKSDMINSDSD